MQPLSVNKAIARAHDLDGACVAIEGILSFETEDVSINHWPKTERREGYASSIWIDPDGVVFGLDEETLAKWSGKRVVVLGVIEGSEESHVDGWENGFGHFGLWPVRIRARRIDLLKRWFRDHPEIEDTEQDVHGNTH
jgi:hypothetical protein